MVVGVDKRSDILIELFNPAAVRIHGIQVVVVSRIAEINGAVVFAENTVVVKVAGGVAVDKRIIPVGSGGKIVKNEVAGNNKNNSCRNEKAFDIFHKKITSVSVFCYNDYNF